MQITKEYCKNVSLLNNTIVRKYTIINLKIKKKLTHDNKKTWLEAKNSIIDQNIKKQLKFYKKKTETAFINSKSVF